MRWWSIFSSRTMELTLYRTVDKPVEARLQVWPRQTYQTFIWLGLVCKSSNTYRIWSVRYPQPLCRTQAAVWPGCRGPPGISAPAQCGSAVHETASLLTSHWRLSPAPHTLQTTRWRHPQSSLHLPHLRPPLHLLLWHSLQNRGKLYKCFTFTYRVKCCIATLLSFQINRQLYYSMDSNEKRWCKMDVIKAPTHTGD